MWCGGVVLPGGLATQGFELTEMQLQHTVDPIEVRNSRTFFCVLCSERWPERQMFLQDGIAEDHRCPNCYEPNGGKIERDLQRAAASELAAAITTRFASPARFPEWLDAITSVRVLDSFTPEPRRLTVGGSSAVLTITGSGLTATDTIVYGHAGITNAVSPLLVPVTYDSDGNAVSPYHDVLSLTVQASGAVPVGAYSLTYDDITYNGVFDVRA